MNTKAILQRAGGVLLAVLLTHNVFRVWRWRALLEPVRVGVPFRPMFSAVILGYMTSWVVGGRVGELVRPALLSGREQLPLGPCLGTVVADRLLDGLAVLALFAIGMLVAPLQGEAATHVPLLRTGALTLVAVIGAVVVLLAAASSLESRFRDGVMRRGLVGWLARSLFAVSRGIQALKRPRLLARVVLQTMLAWGAILLATWLGIRASGADISPGDAMILLPLLALGIAVPTPGAVGGYHAAMTFGLTRLFGVDAAVAAGAAFLMHALVLVPVIVLGLVLLIVDRMPFGDLVRAARQIKDLGDAPVERAP